MLGPFQGRAAPARIALTHPTLGRAVRESRSIVTEDMATFAFGDDELPARSQTAVPLFAEDTILGLLVVDSPFVGRFGDDDRIGLEAAAELLVLASDMSTVRAVKSGAKRKPAAPARENTAQGKFSFSRFGLPAIPPAARAPRSENGTAAGLQIEITDDDLRKSHTGPRAVPAVTGEGEAPAPMPRTVERPQIAGRKQRIRKPASRSALILRRVIFFASAAIFLTLAVTGAVYEAAAPGDAPWHAVLRKMYGVLAFAWLGFWLALSFRMGVRRAALTMAGFSILIEAGQFGAGAREDTLLHVVDIFSGALGGYIGALCARAARKAKYRRAH